MESCDFFLRLVLVSFLCQFVTTHLNAPNTPYVWSEVENISVGSVLHLWELNLRVTM